MSQLYPNNSKSVPTIAMTIPLFVRVLELVREDVKSDVNLHIILEKIIELSNNNLLDMSSYECIAKANPK